MISKEFLDLLICPEERVPLAVADGSLLADVNRAIRAGCLRNRAGQTVRQALEAGLVTRNRTVLYPVVDGIPILLADEGILLAQLDETH